ncbi:MAG: hypothetical protein EBU46_16575, partial [Nitrosomonadaceae bacterium]|nr:hypothetical protein [Nitrosomonadaceae bacterium]
VEEVVAVGAAQAVPLGGERAGGGARAHEEGRRRHLAGVPVDGAARGEGGHRRRLRPAALGVGHLEGEDPAGVGGGEPDVLGEARPLRRVEGAAGVGVDEDVAVGEALEGLRDKPALPQPEAAAAGAGAHERPVGGPEGSADEVGLAHGAHLVEGERGGLGGERAEGPLEDGVRVRQEDNAHVYLCNRALSNLGDLANRQIGTLPIWQIGKPTNLHQK